jgi:hypothetical protein
MIIKLKEPLTMKKPIIILAAGVFLMLSFSFINDSHPATSFPDDVVAILESACYDCHTTGAKSKDALKAVNYDEWDSYRVSKKVGLLGEICEVVEKGKMPPKKYLEHQPDKALTPAQKELLCSWAKKESEKLMAGE